MVNKSLNSNLHKANKAKKDEFYTQLIDIEKELKHYKEQFRGKVVYCNCDDPFESNFFKYFAANFNALGLKKLITTSYTKSPIAGGQLPLFEMEGLKPDGKEPYVVVTNPPFSLFREYIAQLVEYNKKFLIIGNVNAITYKECFKLIRDNKLWLGASIHSGDREFRVPDHYPLEAAGSRVDEKGNKYIRVKGVRWFTNLDYEERHENLVLYKKYSPSEYPKYDNYDAIEVSKTADIPMNYKGDMGVPITFLDKYNPEQFEILGLANDKREIDKAFIQGSEFNLDEQHKRFVGMVLNKKSTYARILIKQKK